MDFLSKLVDSDVGRGTDKDLAWVHFREMVDDGGRSDGFTRAGRPLDEADRLLQDALHSVHLRVVQLGKAWGREAFGHLGAKDLRFKVMSKEFVILDTRD